MASFQGSDKGIENPRVGSSILSLGTRKTANSAGSAIGSDSTASAGCGTFHWSRYTRGTGSVSGPLVVDQYRLDEHGGAS